LDNRPFLGSAFKESLIFTGFAGWVALTEWISGKDGASGAADIMANSSSKPFVLETELSDYYPCYQINAYIKDADKLGDIYSGHIT